MARFLVGRHVQIRCVFVLSIAALFAAAQAIAQSSDRHLTLLGIPSATIAPHGTGFVSLQYTNQRPGPAKGSDASLSFGIGLGDAENTIGVQLSAEVTSTTNKPGDSGYFDLRLSRRISDGATPVYLGVGAWRLGAWGNAKGQDVAGDLTLTFFPAVETAQGTTRLMVSLGAGTHVRANQTEPGGYAGIGFGFTRNFGASAAWYGDHAIFGVSYRPTRIRNVQFTAALVDAFDNTNDRRAVFSVNLIFPKAF